MVAKFAPEDSLVACGGGDGNVRIYNLLKNSKIADVNTNVKDKESPSSTPVNALKWRPNSEKMESVGAVVLAANTNGHLFQFVAKTGKQLWHSVEPGNQIFTLDYSHDGRYFASAGLENTIRIYDEETKKTSHDLKGELRRKTGHNNRIFTVKFNNQNPALLVSGGWDQNVTVG
jgi:COMPASS component SWD3